MTANTLKTSNNWLGDYCRRMKTKGGHKYVIVATSRKLAIIYYRVVRYKQPFTPFDNDRYQEKYRQSKIANLEKALKRLKDQAA
jgi:transposase